jgi:uncharacterized protein YxjI
METIASSTAIHDPFFDQFDVFHDDYGNSRHSLPHVLSYEMNNSAEIVEQIERERLKMHQEEHEKRHSTQMEHRMSRDHILDPLIEPWKIEVMPVLTRRSIPIRVLDNQGKMLYKVEMNAEMTDIKVMSPSNRQLCRITKEVITLRPSFSIMHKKQKIAKCSQRFSLSKEKKFIYKMKYGATLKMTGYYNQSSWIVKNNLKIIGNVNVISAREYEVRVTDQAIDRFHILIMCLIMMEQKFNNTDARIY